MTEDDLRKWIPLLGGNTTADEGAEWVHTNCVLAASRHQNGTDSTPSMGFQVGPGESRVHCFSCMYSGTQMDLIMELQVQGFKLPWDKLIGGINAAIEGAPFGWEDGHYEQIFEKVDHEYPADLVENITEPAYFEEDVHPYLAARAVSYKTAKDWDLRLDPYRNRIVVPVRDFNGVLRGLHGRSVNPLAKLKYLMYPNEGKTNPHVLLGEHLVTGDDPIVLPESMFDLFRVYEIWPNVLSPLKAGITVQTIQRMEGASMIITLFDGDKAGEIGREKVAKHSTSPVHHLIPPAGEDAGMLSTDELKEGIYQIINSV